MLINSWHRVTFTFESKKHKAKQKFSFSNTKILDEKSKKFLSIKKTEDAQSNRTGITCSTQPKSGEIFSFLTLIEKGRRHLNRLIDKSYIVWSSKRSATIEEKSLKQWTTLVPLHGNFLFLQFNLEKAGIFILYGNKSRPQSLASSSSRTG